MKPEAPIIAWDLSGNGNHAVAPGHSFHPMDLKPQTLEIDGWKYNNFRHCMEKGKKKIYRPDTTGFVVSYDEVWVDGHYPTFELAVKAFRMTDEERAKYVGNG